MKKFYNEYGEEVFPYEKLRENLEQLLELANERVWKEKQGTSEYNIGYEWGVKLGLEEAITAIYDIEEEGEY